MSWILNQVFELDSSGEFFLPDYTATGFISEVPN